jgi:mono/diheme cytochrome c family protein
VIAALFASGAALALQPLIGHIGALEGSTRAVLIPIEIAHLLAAGAWLGGLAPLLLCVVRAPPPLAASLCARFTPVGLVAVGTIAVTALPQAGEMIGGVPGLFGTQYGRMALIKLGLFFLALALACLNRLVLTERLGRGLERRWLIDSIAIEAAAAFCVVLAAAAMASSVPAAHTQPVWPFAWRPSTAAWDEPEARGELVHLLIASAAGLSLVGGSLIMRRFRVIAAVIAMTVIVRSAPALSLLLVEAYPSSYARSTTGFSVAAIVRGETLFSQRCAECHDPQNGSGGPGDLTARHVWGHLNGEMFWWITNGVADPGGAALMPGFGSVLTEDDRWALIDFVHARNIGMQARDTGRWSPPIAAPATPLSCSDSDAGAVADLATHVLRFVVEGDTPAALPARNEPASVTGAVTVRLLRGVVGTPRQGECVAASPMAWEAWRVLAGIAPRWFPGYQAVVDGHGWLRAWVRPDSGHEQLLAAIRDAVENPVASGERPDNAHHH